MADRDAPLSRNETIKRESRLLRGGIEEGLARKVTGAIEEDDTQLLKFHGTYQQDDRDLRPERGKRKLEKAFSFMVRVRIPGGVLTPAQFLALDAIARAYGNGTMRLTSRQSVQLHGVLKSNLRTVIAAIAAAGLDTRATCGDVNRTVMCTTAPLPARLHEEVLAIATAISEHLLPQSSAYQEMWLGTEGGADGDEEPIYGPTYLPRKFKIGLVVPPANDVDVLSQDLGFIAVVERGALAGFTVTAGGGMGATHGEAATYPRLAEPFGFCTPERAVSVAEAVLRTQRDYGDRADRKHARLKYTIADRGLEWFRSEVEARLGETLAPARPFTLSHTGDRFGWNAKLGTLTVLVPGGRLVAGDAAPVTALARLHRGTFRITPNQNLVIAGIAPSDRGAIAAALAGSNLDAAPTKLRGNAMACVALPTCGLALAESERYLPELAADIDALLAEAGLANAEILLRVSGCPNGCSRPYLAEIGLVGRAPGHYDLHLGGGFDGGRLASLYRPNLDHEAILETLGPLFRDYAGERREGERFGDFVLRKGYRASPKE
ncbi:MAG TPA: NADPH-dependent assimilatory sulfite reductase hemoprotein subunit [Acetobacteraceae bacterium]|nr:NADPH-dependent assimilatory sulfite reductase hemoprotein subunit [Acetobacteraceae bacterium]